MYWSCILARRYDFGRKGIQEGATGYSYGDDDYDDYNPYPNGGEYKFTGFGGVKYEGMSFTDSIVLFNPEMSYLKRINIE